MQDLEYAYMTGNFWLATYLPKVKGYKVLLNNISIIYIYKPTQIWYNKSIIFVEV